MLSNNTGVQAPPSGGTYDYNAWSPGAPGFPVPGGTYLDPVFGAVDPTGSTVRRLTILAGLNPGQDIYGHHFLNADGTNFFWQDVGGTRVVRKVSDGSLVRSGISWPSSSTPADISWHPTDPNFFFYPNGSDLMKYNVSAGTEVAVNSAGKFPSALQALGGSLDLVDATGTKFCVQYGGVGHVYDSTSDTVYSGTSAGAPGGGYFCMSPDAKYAILVSSIAFGSYTGGNYLAYPLDHVNKVMGSPFIFWNEPNGGDHAGFVSASDGKNYMLRQDNFQNPTRLYVAELKDEGARTAAQMRTDNFASIIVNGSGLFDVHISGVGRGTFQDWIFFNTEYGQAGEDVFGTGTFNPAGWQAYENEIMVINVLTHEIRRFAHHRSRSCQTQYDYQPKVSVSWDGSTVHWVSNFNINSTNILADAYAIQNPLGASSSGGSTPLRKSPSIRYKV